MSRVRGSEVDFCLSVSEVDLCPGRRLTFVGVGG